MRRERGAVVVETALTAGIGLTILLFSIKVGLIGFLQITADAASFVNAHGNAVGTLDPLGAADQTHQIFPQIATADIQSSPQPAPSVTFPVNYSIGSIGNRHAGASMMEPELYSSTVTPHGFQQYLGKTWTVSGQSVEPLWLECAPHFNVADSTSQCGATGQPANYAVNYFTAGENTPPYYIGFNYKLRCTLVQPWSGCPNSYNVANNYMALGVAEFLDVHNWSAAGAGAYGTGKSGANPVSTFEYMACHQRVYNSLVAFFSNYVSIQAIYNAFPAALAGQLTGRTGAISDYRYWDEFTTSYPTPSANDNLVREVYNWDAIVSVYQPINAAVEPGATPTHPDAGC